MSIEGTPGSGPPADGAGGYVTVELSPAEATSGVTWVVTVPPGGQLVYVTIPPGVVDGSVLRMTGMGSPDPRTGRPGDLTVRVRVLDPSAPQPVGPPAPAAPPFGPPAAAPPPFAQPPLGPPPFAPPSSAPPSSAPPSSAPPSSAPPYPAPPSSAPPYPAPPASAQPSFGPPPFASPPPAQPFLGPPAAEPPITAAQPSFPQPSYSEPSYSEPTFSQPTFSQPSAMPLPAFPPPPLSATPPPAPTGRRLAPILITVAVVAVLLVLVSVPLLVNSFSGRNAANPHWSGTGSSTSASPSASPSTPPASPEEYQLALDAFGKGLGPGFGGLGGAHTPKAVHDAVNTLQDALTTALVTFKAIVPPPAVQPAHQQLVTGLDALRYAMGETISAADSGKYCGGSSALSSLTGSPAADQVRAGITALAAADPAHPYKIAPFLPAATPNANRQLGNGAVIKKNTKGSNSLKIENRYSTDAVISIAPANSKSAALMVYVRAGGTSTANGIHDGTYDVFMTTGSDWDSGAKSFTRDCDYEQFTESAVFRSTSTQYTVITLTLNMGVGGNTSATAADPGSFPG